MSSFASYWTSWKLIYQLIYHFSCFFVGIVSIYWHNLLVVCVVLCSLKLLNCLCSCCYVLLQFECKLPLTCVEDFDVFQWWIIQVCAGGTFLSARRHSSGTPLICVVVQSPLWLWESCLVHGDCRLWKTGLPFEQGCWVFIKTKTNKKTKCWYRQEMLS